MRQKAHLCSKPTAMAHGRSKHLIRLRDEALLLRYYHWTEVRRIRFDDTLRILSEQEFFLSEERIMSIVRAHWDFLETLRSGPAPGGSAGYAPTDRHRIFLFNGCFLIKSIFLRNFIG
jgi:hypothetical protein